jgi:hypothetical protein
MALRRSFPERPERERDDLSGDDVAASYPAVVSRSFD